MLRLANPAHPGEIIREDVIGALGLSVTKAAEILGVRRAPLSDVTPTARRLSRLKWPCAWKRRSASTWICC